MIKKLILIRLVYNLVNPSLKANPFIELNSKSE